MAQTFTYHRAIAPMIWMLVALSLVELVVTHALIAVWWPMVALALSLITLTAVVWLVWAVRSFRHLPVIVDADALVMRVGRIKSVTIPRAQVKGLRAHWTGEDINQRAVLNLALLAYPNVVIDLHAPIGRRRRITAVAHRLDDPAGFAAALAALGEPDDH